MSGIKIFFLSLDLATVRPADGDEPEDLPDHQGVGAQPEGPLQHGALKQPAPRGKHQQQRQQRQHQQRRSETDSMTNQNSIMQIMLQ